MVGLLRTCLRVLLIVSFFLKKKKNTQNDWGVKVKVAKLSSNILLLFC